MHVIFVQEGKCLWIDYERTHNFFIICSERFFLKTILVNPSCVHHVECLKVRYWLCTNVSIIQAWLLFDFRFSKARYMNKCLGDFT